MYIYVAEKRERVEIMSWSEQCKYTHAAVPGHVHAPPEVEQQARGMAYIVAEVFL